LDTFRKKVEEETTARIRKEMADEQTKKEKDRQELAKSIPRTLSDVHGTSESPQVWGGPLPLDAILKH